MTHSVFPVLCSGDVAAARDFYVRLFGLRVVFDSGWYAQLQDPGEPRVQLGLVARDHDSVPERFRLAPRGVLVTLEVADVDTIHARARELGLPVELSLRDEAFGQRHFMTVDPDGLLVDVVKVIPFAPEFAAAYGLDPDPSSGDGRASK